MIARVFFCILCNLQAEVHLPQVGFEVLCDLTNQPLERQLADKQLGGLLILADLTQSHGTRSVPVGLLHTTCGKEDCKLRKLWAMQEVRASGHINASQRR
jgi:hypothetical protein